MLINSPVKPLKLEKTVAGNAPMGEMDAVAAKEALWRTGDYTPPFGKINPLPERDLLSGIRHFQTRNGLKPDGEMQPGGPTERLLRAAIGQSPDRLTADALRRQPLTGSIGAGGHNRPRDRQTLKTMLTLTGQFDPKSPPEDEGFYLSAAIRNLQSEFNLPRSSTLSPGDETEKALRKSLDLHADGDPRDPYRKSLDKVKEEREQLAQAAGSSAASAGTTKAPRAPKRPQPSQSGVPTSAPPIPTYKDQFIDPSEWKDWYDTLEASGLSENQKTVFREIFAAEGGLARDGDTVAGITRNTIDITTDQTNISKGTLPKDLTDEERILVYEAFLNRKEYFGSVQGIERLDELDDSKAAAALADTLFRHGSGEGTRIIQGAINETAEQVGLPVEVDIDGRFGSRTFMMFKRMANADNTKNVLLDNIAKNRTARKPDEPDRANHFTFQ